jgi:iron complex transport system permease protein
VSTTVQSVALRAPASRRALGLTLLLVALALVALASIAVGARDVPLTRVWDLVWHPDGSDEAIIVHDLRIPRTILGLLVGSAIGVAGALMQGLTRNPLADPGLLGVNAGAAAAVVTATVALGTTDPLSYVWFAFLGAAGASVLVYGIGSAGRSGATPVRLVLAGTAVTFALLAYVQAMVLLDPEALDRFRFWQVGALSGHPASLNAQIAPFVGAGLVLAFALGRPLNALGLGEDHGRALGAHPGRTRVLGALAITLLCGAGTAAAGPIIFLGLAVPHIARAITGPDQRWVLPYSALLAPTLLLAADVLGRVVARPGELQVSIVCAVLGGPVFIAIVRRRRIPAL